jgi:hypothetical protein
MRKVKFRLTLRFTVRVRVRVWLFRFRLRCTVGVTLTFRFRVRFRFSITLRFMHGFIICNIFVFISSGSKPLRFSFVICHIVVVVDMYLLYCMNFIRDSYHVTRYK